MSTVLLFVFAATVWNIAFPIENLCAIPLSVVVPATAFFLKLKKKESPPFCQKILNQIKEYKIDKNLSNIFLVNNVLSCNTSLTPT